MGNGGRLSKEVTEVIIRNIEAGREKDYDDWLERFMISERQFPGYLGTTIIAPGGNISSTRYVINRFSDQASLDAWEKSEVALSLLEEVNKYSTHRRRQSWVQAMGSISISHGIAQFLRLSANSTALVNHQGDCYSIWSPNCLEVRLMHVIITPCLWGIACCVFQGVIMQKT